MICVICKNGITRPGTITATFERDEAILVVKEIPADLCGNCGEGYMAQHVTTSLLAQVQVTAKTGFEVSIRRYSAD